MTFNYKRLLLETCMDHTEFSKKGGSSKSERKQASSRANIAKARLARASRGNTPLIVRTAVSDQPGEAAARTDSAGMSVSKNTR